MSPELLFIAQQLEWLISVLLVLFFASKVLAERRPTGSAYAWLLAIVLIPYVGIPLYLMFGGRKFKQRAASKARISLESGQFDGPTPLQFAGELTWLDDGVAAFDAIIRQIENAQRSIRIVTFVIGDDEAGRAIAAALTRRAAAGVEVCLLLDGLLSFRAPHRELARLRAAGGWVEIFMPLLHLPFRGRSNLRNHRKLAIFDHERALVGGMNLADEYLGPRPKPERWRDLSALLAGPCVATLDAVFRADWRFVTGLQLESAQPAATQHGRVVPLRIVPTGPDRPSDPLYDALLQSIFMARQRVWISTPYFAPDESLGKALEIAVRRGVNVRVLVPARSNHRVADLVAAPKLRRLARLGVEVHCYTAGMLHTKAMLVDRSLALIGSANFDMRSLFLDYEISLLLHGETEADWLAGWFERSLEQAAPGARPAGRLRAEIENAAQLLAPLV